MSPFDIERVSRQMAVFMVSAIYPSFRSERLKLLNAKRNELLSEISLIDSEIKALSALTSWEQSK